MPAEALIMVVKTHRLTFRAWAFSIGLPVVVAVLLANSFAAWFVAEEHFVYFWDLAGYWMTFGEVGDSIRNAPVDGLREVFSSVRNIDYNALPVLHLLPFEWLLGGSRLSYVLAITNIAVLPSALIMGVVVRRLLSPSIGTVSYGTLLLGAACTLLQPSLWAPALRGLPDVIGIALIGVVLLVHFSKPLEAQRPVVVVATGMLLCILMLERRWYAYWVVGFFPALVAAHALELHARHGLTWRPYANATRNAIAIGLVFVSALFLIATPMAMRVLGTDYSDIHSAYRLSDSMPEIVATVPSYFGWSVLLLGLSGLARLAINQRTRAVSVFLVVQSLVVFGLFARTQDFDIQHFYLFLPAISIGVSSITVGIWQSRAGGVWRAAGVGLVLVTLLASGASVFLPRAALIESALGGLVPRVQHYPLVRGDLDELERILRLLGELEERQRGKIYVLASSETLNSDIVEVGCRVSSQRLSYCDDVLTASDVDKRDGFPQEFRNASYVLVASPIQYHLRSEDQRVIGVLAREMLNEEGLGAAFERVPAEFILDHGVAVHVYTKIRLIGQTDIEAVSGELVRHYPTMRDLFRVADAVDERSSVTTP